MHKKDSFGQCAIHLAAEGGSVEVRKLLLAAGSDQNMPDGQGQTPLHTAAEEGHVGFARALLENGGAPSMSVLYRGATPFQWAAKAWHHACGRVLKSLSETMAYKAPKHDPATHRPAELHQDGTLRKFFDGMYDMDQAEIKEDN